MAANKFATMLHRNTNKMTLILVYALLEWTLIALLLFNSLFSYLIVKFADYFGLKRPCLWCSRLDHVFDNSHSHRDLICESHAMEISDLQFCLSHRRLAESRHLCDDCSSHKDDENSNPNPNSKCCSCCGASFSNKRSFYHIMINSWGVSDYDFPGKNKKKDEISVGDSDDHCGSEEQRIEENRGEGNGNGIETLGAAHLEFCIGEEDSKLIPIGSEDVVLELDTDANQKERAETWRGLGDTFGNVAEEAEFDMFKPVLVSQGTQTDEDDDDESDGDDIDLQNDEEIDGEISIGTEIPDHEPIDENEVEIRQVEVSYHLCDQQQGEPKEDPPTIPISLNIHENHDIEQSEREFVEFKPTLSVQTSLREDIDQEEDKVLDTPSSIDSLLHKKLALLGAEDSLDGLSVVSDIEGVETVEKLRTALKTERKALGALYSELEEERCASAEAARQTMAMINRLQEEKAAMQMEAVQYQRMMEEQSEYDQEALQMLNELMIKRENERKELEKEVELYKRKVEELTRTRTIARRRNSSASTSNEEESEEASTSDGDDGQNTPEEAVLYLEESLSGFEEERLSILDQLRVLEEKLFTLTDNDEDDDDGDSERVDHSYRQNGNANGNGNGNGYHHDGSNGVANGHSKEMKESHDHDDGDNHGSIMGIQAKRLLPFFDAEAEDGIANGNGGGGCHEYIGSVFEFEEKRPTVEEEVDRVYERLQALEADREFLRHCISSLKKGDKGLCLLREILQHLRDLRSVESRVNNMEEDGVL